MNQKTTLLAGGIAVVLIAVALGFYLGNKKSEQAVNQIERKYQPLIDAAFPKPADDMRSLVGVIKAITGATLTLEIDDPEDYFPHTDGTSQAKATRFASLTKNTNILLINTTKLNHEGNPSVTELKLSDLTVGDAIVVRSDTNIRSAQKFDVTQIELVK